MTFHRVILEMGAGIDLHGGNYTKAAVRAVKDALQHSSLSFIQTLHIEKNTLRVEVTVGVQKPEEVSLEKVKVALPIGVVTVHAVKGGLDVVDPILNEVSVVATAAIQVRIQRPCRRQN